ncbi:MAG: hypothetical protein IPP94_12565 [Ignavibacteria bacterium]|nr:hypothetical protein [Ignavibacteria bacterium]
MHGLIRHIIAVSLLASYLSAMSVVTIADSWRLGTGDGHASFVDGHGSNAVDPSMRIFQRRHLSLLKPLHLVALSDTAAQRSAVLVCHGPAIVIQSEPLLQLDTLRLVTARPPPAA